MLRRAIGARAMPRPSPPPALLPMSLTTPVLRRHCSSTRDSPLERTQAQAQTSSQTEPQSANHETRQSALHPRKARRLLPSANGPLVQSLIESDLEEKFVSGGGKGGQKVNKSRNAVFLRHVPTGHSVKVHAGRSLSENRKIARQRLWAALDDRISRENGTESFRDVRVKMARRAERRAHLRARKKHAGHAAERSTDPVAAEE